MGEEGSRGPTPPLRVISSDGGWRGRDALLPVTRWQGAIHVPKNKFSPMLLDTHTHTRKEDWLGRARDEREQGRVIRDVLVLYQLDTGKSHSERWSLCRENAPIGLSDWPAFALSHSFSLPLVVALFCLLPKTGFLCGALTVLELCRPGWPQRSACLCLLRANINDVPSWACIF